MYIYKVKVVKLQHEIKEPGKPRALRLTGDDDESSGTDAPQFLGTSTRPARCDVLD
jgi:hypothetical protein